MNERLTDDELDQIERALIVDLVPGTGPSRLKSIATAGLATRLVGEVRHLRSLLDHVYACSPAGGELQAELERELFAVGKARPSPRDDAWTANPRTGVVADNS